WEAVKMFRPIPVELRGQREVIIGRIVLFASSVALAVILPFVLHKSDIFDLQVLPIYGIVAVSLVILTGWAGQISLGQFGIVAMGAAAAGGLVANHNIEFFEAVAIGVAAGVIVSVVIGLPAVRIQGLYLAVTTLAFAYAMPSYILNTHYWIGKHIMPSGLTAHLERPVLYGRIDLANERTFYFVCVAFLAVAMLVALSFRKNRSGRVLIAARDNQRAAPSYAINLVRARLAAFAVAGGIAGMAGVLFAYEQHNVIPGSFRVENSIAIFLATVIGGLTSVPWAVVGAVSVEALTLFGPRAQHLLGETLTSVLPLLALGPLLILNLYFYPGGTAEANFKLRDKFLRWVAKRHDILVPSLVADRRVETGEADTELIEGAEHSVVEAEG